MSLGTTTSSFSRTSSPTSCEFVAFNLKCLPCLRRVVLEFLTPRSFLLPVVPLRYVYSDWGRHELRQDLFEEEFTFLLQNVRQVIRLGDPELVGEFLHCLRIFGVGIDSGGGSGGKKANAWREGAEQWMGDGVAYLLNTERRFGSKGSWVSDNTEFYTRYHAAYCGIVGLLELGDMRRESSAEGAVKAERGSAEARAELCNYAVPRPFVVANKAPSLAPPVCLDTLVAEMSGTM